MVRCSASTGASVAVAVDSEGKITAVCGESKTCNEFYKVDEESS